MGLLHKKNEDGTKTKTSFGVALGKTLASTSKQLVWVYTLNGIAWIWCSYILAFMDKFQIAETLSGNVCTVVIGQIGFYLVTKTFENVFKYNDVFRTKNQSSNGNTSSDSINNNTTQSNLQGVINYGSTEIPIPEPVYIPSNVQSTSGIQNDAEPVG